MLQRGHEQRPVVACGHHSAAGHMSVEIRTATPDDRDAVLALLTAQLRDHDIATGEAELLRVMDILLVRPHRGRFVVAEEAGRIVGVAALSFGYPLEHG